MAAEFRHLRIPGLEVPVDQAGGAENDISEVANLPAVLLHGGHIIKDIAGHITPGIGVFGSLAINMGLHRLDRLHRGGMGDQHDVIHAFQGGKRAGP